MPLHRDDNRSLIAAAVVLCAALALSVPLATTAVGAVSSGADGISTQAPGTAANAPGNCLDRSAVAGPPSDDRTDRTTAGRNSAEAAAGTHSAERSAADAPDEQVPLGGIAYVSLSVPDGFDTRVEVGLGTNYSVEATVHDDGDGAVVLRINTYAAANGTDVSPRAYDVTGTDGIEVHTNETDAPMTNRTYRVEAVRDDAVVDERLLNVTAPDFGTVTALAGPPQLMDVGTLDAVRTADDLGMLSTEQTEYNRTAAGLGETVVFRFESPSFLGAVAAQPGETATERLGRVHDGHERDPAVAFDITGPCYALDYEASADNGGVRALPDYANGTLYLLVDHDRTEQYVGYGSLAISVEASSPLDDRDEYHSFERAEYGDSNGRPTVDRLGSHQRVDGIVSWPTGGSVEIPGESDWDKVPVTVRSLTDPTQVIRTSVEPADESFRAPVDLPDDSNPGLFEVAVGNTTYTARVGDPPNATWELAPPNGTERVERVPIRQLKLEDGRFLVAYQPVDNGTGFQRVGAADTRDIAVSVAPIDEATHLVAVAHRDGNDNGRFDGPETDPAYQVGGSVVREWITVEPADETPAEDPPLGSFAPSKVGEPAEDVPTVTTPEPTPTATPTRTPTATVTDTPTPTPAATPTATATQSPTPVPAPNTMSPPATETATGDGTTADGPGFGPVAAILALSLVAVQTRRRT